MMLSMILDGEGSTKGIMGAGLRISKGRIERVAMSLVLDSGRGIFLGAGNRNVAHLFKY